MILILGMSAGGGGGGGGGGEREVGLIGPQPSGTGTIGSNCKELEAPMPTGYSGSTGLSVPTARSWKLQCQLDTLEALDLCWC